MAERIPHLKEFKVCRFCLDDAGPFTNIYEKDSRDGKQQIPLPLQIMACVAIEVFSNDGMPQLICNPCRSQTIGAYNFKTTCKKADDTLKLYLATGNRKLVKPLQKKRASSKNTSVLQHIVDQSQTLSAASRHPTPTTLNITASSRSNLNALSKSPPQKRIKLTQAIQSIQSDDEHPDTETIHITMETDPLASESQIDMDEILPTAPTSGLNTDMAGRGEARGDDCGDRGRRERVRDANNSDEGGDTEEEEEEEEEVALREARLYDDEEQERSQILQKPAVTSNVYPCTLCERSFPLVQQLDLHMQNHDRIRNFSCSHDGCGRMFFNKYDLAKHTRTHLDYKPFICVICDKTFSREALLHRHEKIHANVPKYFCTYCDHSFLNREDFDFHVEKHKISRPFQCRICRKGFVFKQGLQRHELVHADEKPHKCNYCEASFTSPIKLMRHITSHAGLRPYPCKLCGRTFLLSHHLTRHLKSHYSAVGGAGTEPPIGQHKCDVCSMSFRRKDSLINHSAIHSMVNLKCVICNTAFETASEVKLHITSHLSGLPYPCDMCDYSFDTQDQLEEHELKHAEMEYEEQIEAEVSKEALDDLDAEDEENERHGMRKMGNTRQDQNEDEADDDDDEDDVEEMAEFTITESGLVPLQRTVNRKHNVSTSQAIHPTSSMNQFHMQDISISRTTTNVEVSEGTDMERASSPTDDSFAGVPKATQRHQVGISCTTNSVLLPLVSTQVQDNTNETERYDEYQERITDVLTHQVTEQEQIRKLNDKIITLNDDVLIDDRTTVTAEITALQKKTNMQTQAQKLKDIVRSEGTKVYARKMPAQRFKPQMVVPPAATMAPLSQINQSTLDTLGLTQQDVNSMPTKKYMDMKVGDKTVRVQKLIMTKAEIAAMAKEGKIEMKGGNLILKKTAKTSLTPRELSVSTSKQPSRISLENILDATPKTIKQRIVTKKTYIKKSTNVPTSIINANKELTITPIVSTSASCVNVDLTQQVEHIKLSTSTDLASPVHSIEEVIL